ncbi:MAG: acylneuraminate cytidylyltransferase family protein [Alphaproteobacteria bacterium]|jgi:CMP-N-acetylneuraminic acid synthetase|nr:acylneuraminate cytidylyltransferase family protein [Alphaproteobacteria bacterium]
MRSLAIIPARIGSTGVRKKNIRPLAGRPLIEYAIEAALASRIDRVVVSTDAPEIAEVARAAGAEVPFLRPVELAANETIAMAVVRHALAYLADVEGWRPDAVAYLQPTSPMRNAAHIDRALELLDQTVDSIWTMVSVAEHPYFMYSPAPGARMLEYVTMDDKPERRQDLPPLYHVNPVIMLSWTRYLVAEGNEKALVVNRDNFRALPISREDGVDINTELDFQLAELLMRRKLAEATDGTAAVDAA